MSPNDPRHETNAGYNQGCRDECCRKAHMIWMKRYRMYGADGLVDARGFERRVRALQAIGYTTRGISAELGRSKSFITATLGQDKVRKATFDAMAAAYERLCMTVPEGWVADRARRQAREAGYLPPLAYDDIDNDEVMEFIASHDDANFIDEVKVQRVLDGKREDCNRAEREAVIDRWEGSIAELQRVTGWNVSRTIARRKAA